MNVHFIAIGGSAMHNLAIALKRNNIKVTGSDDEIFEPSKTRLQKEGILPTKIGWDPALISENVDAVIVGMHARQDNPELLKAQALGLKIYSYPEYLYQQSKDKIRIVIGGSHGKTTITSMLLHACNKLQIEVDYLVGAQLDGYDCMVKISDNAKYMILEGDEYLSSPTDLRPKFHLYQPHIALLSGIAWDHINVFPTFENYVEQFDIFCSMVKDTLIYNMEDVKVKELGEKYSAKIEGIPYQTPKYTHTESGTVVTYNNEEFPLQIFGAHNLQNLIGAMNLAKQMGVSNSDFLRAMHDFTGAGKRLEKVYEEEDFVVFKDFAHSPSKLKATSNAVREQYPNRKLVACMELHTFSSLKKEFLPQYQNSMNGMEKAVVYFNPEVVAHKKLEKLEKSDVQSAFGVEVLVLTETQAFLDFLYAQDWENSVLLLMSSGTFDGVNYEALSQELAKLKNA